MPKGLVEKTSLNSIAEAINVLNGTEGTYAPSEMGEAIIDAILTETASGNPINITDAAAYPAVSCVTTLEPVQDLHGYDKPWPAGGGNNLYHVPEFVSFTKNGITFEYINSSEVKISGTATTTTFMWSPVGVNAFVVPAGTYSFSCNMPSGSSSGYLRLYTKVDGEFVMLKDYIRKNSITSFTFEADTEIWIQTVIPDGLTVDFILWYQLELGSTATSYEPYSNVCPITGHTGVGLTNGADTINLYDKNAKDTENGYVEGKYLRAGGNEQSSAGWKITEYINCKSMFFLKLGGYSASSDVPSVCFYDKDKQYISGVIYNRRSSFITAVPKNAAFFRFSIYGSYDNSAYAYNYSANLSITFPQAQSPVYGGEVDWVNGVLRVKSVKETKVWRDRDGTQLTNVIRGVYVLQNLTIPVNERNTEKICNVAPYKAVYNEDTVHFYVQTDSNNREARAYIFLPTNTDENTEIEICYPLATPLEIPLTPEIITLLKGENNVWTDAGTSKIEYKVDLQSYIQKLIDEASTKASALSGNQLSLSKSAVLTSTDGEDANEIEQVDEPVLYDEVKASDDVGSVGGESEEMPVEDVESVDVAENEPAELFVEEDTDIFTADSD